MVTNFSSSQRSVITFLTYAPLPLSLPYRSLGQSCLPCAIFTSCRRRLASMSAVPPFSGEKKQVIFLGTPDVAANTLSILHAASQRRDSTFDICGIVSQPPAPVGRKRVLILSPVHVLADTLSIGPILTPPKANDPDFLQTISDLSPDLCITAAYGNFLPTRFLKIPQFGTLNIHPSLLPQFRGAAPVPRALEKGVAETGVCILYTILKMDAGPIVHCERRPLKGDEQTPELLHELFDVGANALVSLLPKIWTKEVTLLPQDENQATHAPKLSKDEGRLTFVENAHIVHNKVRAFAGWPGTWADFVISAGNESDIEKEETRLKIVRTVVLRGEGGMCFDVHSVTFNENDTCLQTTCGDGTMVGILEVQPPRKKVMDARSFWNGLRGKSIHWKRLPY